METLLTTEVLAPCCKGGFTFVDINAPPEVNKTMNVTASLQNNNTNINCGILIGQGQREQSATANLLVAGKQ